MLAMAREQSSRSNVLVEGEQIVGVIARFEPLESCVVGGVGASNAALALAVHDIYIGAVFADGQLDAQSIDPVPGGSLAIGMLPVSGHIPANTRPAQWKRRCGHRHTRHGAMKMNKKAIDRKGGAGESIREKFDLPVIELREEAAAVFFIARWGCRQAPSVQVQDTALTEPCRPRPPGDDEGVPSPSLLQSVHLHSRPEL